MSAHGGQMDLIFNVIFVICSVVLLGVLFVMLKFCWTYRQRKGVATKAFYTHGNKKLEIIWTIIPAIILIALAVWTKGAWDEFRYSPKPEGDPNRAQILVIAEQFAWNIVYPGPDGKLGRYLLYPRVTDPKWPELPADQADFFQTAYSGNPRFKGISMPPGPAFLPPADAQKMLNDYVFTINPLGKDFTDPAGLDDNWKNQRTVYVPKGRLVEVQLSSKDVIHDFFLPDYRVKLDAVPGLRGKLYFTALKSSAEFEKASQRSYTIEELRGELAAADKPDFKIVISDDAVKSYSVMTKTTTKRQKKDPDGKIVRGPGGRPVMEDVEEQQAQQVATNGQSITPAMLDDLKKLNLPKFDAYRVKTWDLVCEELCGIGHTSMGGSLVVLEPEEYARRFEGKSGTPPMTQPAAPVVLTAPGAPVLASH